MLEALDGSSVIARLWSATIAQAVLNKGRAEFFALSGPAPRQFESRRSYHRFYYRRQAILAAGKTLLGVYTADVSQQGISFLSPQQLFPLDSVTLLIPGPKKTTLEIARCRRIQEGCYDCGAVFIDVTTRAASQDAFPEIANQLVLG